MALTINFSNKGNGVETGTRVYRSNTPITKDNVAELLPVGILNTGATQFVDQTAEEGSLYYYIFQTFRTTDDGEETVCSNPICIKAIGQNQTGPGPQSIRAGDWHLGYFGNLRAYEFITNDQLKNHFNITGTTGKDLDWMKFAYKGKVLFIPMAMVSTNVSYKTLYEAGLVYGTNDSGLCIPDGSNATDQYRTIQKGEYRFKVRLWNVGEGETDLLPPVNVGDSSNYNSPTLLPDFPQRPKSEFEDIMSAIHKFPLFKNDPDFCKFGYLSSNMYASNSSNRETEWYPQPAGTTDKTKANTRGICANMSTYQLSIPAPHGVSIASVTSDYGYDTNYFGSSYYVKHGWRPILELEN